MSKTAQAVQEAATEGEPTRDPTVDSTVEEMDQAIQALETEHAAQEAAYHKEVELREAIRELEHKAGEQKGAWSAAHIKILTREQSVKALCRELAALEEPADG
jgi:hypothetical protein